MSTVTLVGTRLAEPGTEFVYQGEADGCAGCPYRSQCLNLSPETTYRITDVRENAQTLECAMHDNGVRAVEVEPVSVRANVPSQRIRRQQGELTGPLSVRRVPQPRILRAGWRGLRRGVPDSTDYRRPTTRPLLSRPLTRVGRTQRQRLNGSHHERHRVLKFDAALEESVDEVCDQFRCVPRIVKQDDISRARLESIRACREFCVQFCG